MDADDLYGLALERFVPERAALAKALRAEGRRDEAAEIAKLRKPSVAAWAVNQLVRTQGRAMKELFDAGDALRAAHEAALSGGGDGRALRAAGERERQAVEALVRIARGLLDDQGHELSEPMIDRVAETLRAGSRDDDARAQVAGGRLERELRQLGLGMDAAPAGAPAPAGPKKKPKAKAKQVDKRAAERERIGERERAAVRKAAEAAETKARKAAERADRALETAQERRDRAAQALAEADRALAAARKEAEAAAAAHRRARAKL